MTFSARRCRIFPTGCASVGIDGIRATPAHRPQDGAARLGCPRRQVHGLSARLTRRVLSARRWPSSLGRCVDRCPSETLKHHQELEERTRREPSRHRRPVSLCGDSHPTADEQLLATAMRGTIRGTLAASADLLRQTRLSGAVWSLRQCSGSGHTGLVSQDIPDSTVTLCE